MGMSHGSSCLLFGICHAVKFSVVRDAEQCLFVGSKDGATHGNDARARAAIWTWHEGRRKTQRRESGRVLWRGQELQSRQRPGQTVRPLSRTTFLQEENRQNALLLCEVCTVCTASGAMLSQALAS